MPFKLDLHIHSCLSPCGSLEMSPSKIVETALRNKINLIALTDHNSARNIPAFAEICRQKGLPALFGLEFSTMEEVHMLMLFEHPQQAVEAGLWAESHLQTVRNKPNISGDQVYVDKDEIVLGEVENYLVASTDISLHEAVEETHKRHGLAIPSHVDRPYFSIGSQLGFLPEEDFDALEYVGKSPPFDNSSLPLLRSSDAHYPENIGARTTELKLKEASFQGLKEYLQNAKRL